jgi:hypothetical protein
MVPFGTKRSVVDNLVFVGAAEDKIHSGAIDHDICRLLGELAAEHLDGVSAFIDIGLRRPIPSQTFAFCVIGKLLFDCVKDGLIGHAQVQRCRNVLSCVLFSA